MALTTKQRVLQLLDELPEDCTIADVQYRLYVLDAIERGRADLASGGGIAHEDAMERIRAKWGFSKGG